MSPFEPLHGLLPLAQVSKWKALGTRFSGEHLQVQTEDIVGLLLLVAALVGGFWLLKWAAKWQETSPREPSPKRLFAELTRAHRLSLGQRKMCREVAVEIGAKTPSEMFVRTEGRDALRARDAGLAETLFGPTA